MNRLFALFFLFLTLPLAARAEEGAVDFIRFDWMVEPNREQFYAATTYLFEAFGPDERLYLYAEYGIFDGVYALTTTRAGQRDLRKALAGIDESYLTTHLEPTSSGQSPLHNYLLYTPYWNEMDRTSGNNRQQKEKEAHIPEPLSPVCTVIRKNQMGSIKRIAKAQLKMIQQMARHGHLMSVTYRPGDNKNFRDLIFTFRADCAHKDEIVAELMALMDGK
ncbi:hypothetical protein [Emcibacter sp.]|uniref:hypothetical protein n=1 Tax=Emcibacter sp. TaxID=1979954 RepID=UPI002AA72FFC|nr:hypothetical protein [Emcibacter sp.]